MAKFSRPIAFWLEQIVFFSDRLARHHAGMSALEFVRDLKAIDAASWCIGCIGESAGRILQIDPRFELSNPDLELTPAYAARNRYIHGYYDLDSEQIWETATLAVPKLSLAARKILDGQRQDETPATG